MTRFSFNEASLQSADKQKCKQKDSVQIPDLNYLMCNVQDRLSSLLKTAENLKVKGLAEVSGDDKDSAPSSASASVSRLSAGPPPMTMMGRAMGVASSSPAPGGQENNNTVSNSWANINGEIKKKRGRPRTLDGPEDEADNVFAPRISMVQGGLNGGGSGTQSPILSHSLTSAAAKPQHMSPLQAALSKPLAAELTTSKDNSNSSPPVSKPSTPCPPSPATGIIKVEQGEVRSDTPGSLNGTFVATLSAETVSSWGIIKMNDYLVSGTRQQYWEEYFVKNVMGVSFTISLSSTILFPFH